MSSKKVVYSCKHDFQDETYGKGGVRVVTTTQQKPSPGTVVVRCTVCKKEHTVKE